MMLMRSAPPAMMLLLTMCCVSLWTTLSASQAYAFSPESEMTRLPTPVPSQERKTYLVPSMGVNFGFSRHAGPPRPGPKDTFHPSFWLGANLHPNARNISPFIGASLEIEWHDYPDGGSATYYMPMAKVGVAWLGDCAEAKEQNYLTATLPCASIYALGGARTGWPGMGPSMRVGIGVNLLVLSVAACMAEVFLPNVFEVLYEQDFEGRSMTMFRFGLGF